MTTPYDLIAYPTGVFAQTHPHRLAAHRAMFGLPFVSAERCRVLDVGCGDGANLIPMAVAAPESSFVGLDLSREAIGRGRAVIEDLGLTNVRLEVGDLTAVDYGPDAFDYVIAHGVYAWVPPEVAAALLRLIRRSLSPDGVAFVSYNAKPGAYVRMALRDMLRFRLAGIDDHAARLETARAFLSDMVERFPEADPNAAAFRYEADGMLKRPPGALAHDELGEIWLPRSLTEFAAEARAAGLQFLTEAEATRAGEGFRPPHALDDEDFDVLVHAQLLDFQAARSFRQTLLVHAEAAIDRRPNPSAVRGLQASADVRREADDRFVSARAELKVADGPLGRALERLGAVWPDSLPVADLADDDARLLNLLRLYWTDVIELSAEPRRFARAGERPLASPLARRQAARPDEPLVTLRHTLADISDPTSRRFVTLLDGTRDRRSLTSAMAESLKAGEDQVRPELERSLAGLARMGLLIG